ncbi:MAG: hypothetical protein NXI21_16445 [Alphaproteobacteria bacterium]|nr:hypothetical protein [Alphaproteobacteria bacterium]
MDNVQPNEEDLKVLHAEFQRLCSGLERGVHIKMSENLFAAFKKNGWIIEENGLPSFPPVDVSDTRSAADRLVAVTADPELEDFTYIVGSR